MFLRHLTMRVAVGVAVAIILTLLRTTGAFGANLEVSYTERTTTLNVTATSEASADTIVTANAFTADGSTPYLMEFFAPEVQNGGGCLIVTVYDGSTSLGWHSAACSRGEHHMTRRFTPASGSHTYSVRVWHSSGSGGSVTAANGGSGSWSPAFLRLTYANPDLAAGADLSDYYTKEEGDDRYALKGEGSCGGLGEDPCAVAGAFGLSDDDRQRLDLNWWGTWAIVGLLFVAIAAPRWFAAFRTTHGA